MTERRDVAWYMAAHEVADSEWRSYHTEGEAWVAAINTVATILRRKKMVTAATLKAIHSHLDSEPNDWQARRELADIYEELGRDAEARFQRWLVGNEAAPKRSDRNERWYWSGTRVLITITLVGVGDDGYVGRRTRTLAEECLREALEGRGYELPHPLPRKEGG